jgi:PrtD family type I secretion system ABC transporter
MTKHKAGELRDALARHRGALWGVALFSAVVNILMLTGPLFMLQVYDRVLSSRSGATLAVLLALVIMLYGLMALLDLVRGRVLSRIGASFQASLDGRVLDATLHQSTIAQLRAQPATGLRDLATVQGFVGSPLLASLFDLPWTPLFVAVLFVFHPLMGWFAIGGAIVLAALALWNQHATREAQEKAAALAADADNRVEALRQQVETVRGLGMQAALGDRWRKARGDALTALVATADAGGGFTAVTKAVRLFLQSGILALGAWLVLQGDLTGGAMIAGSILLGRALAPIEQVVGQWGQMQRARSSWRTLDNLLHTVPEAARPMPLPRPESRVVVAGLGVTPPGERTIVLQGVSFDLQPGEAMAVIGPSASGKTSLARALAGVWTPAAGSIRLGGAEISHYAADEYGRLVGYLPQDVTLFAGTVAENISRFASDADAQAIVDAAKAANAHELILGLPGGYDATVSEGGGRLSGGQRQRIGLARAFFGDPCLLILDEPNSALDEPGVSALNHAVVNAKKEGRCVILMSHRPSALAHCEKVLLLENGRQKSFGARDDVLQRFVKGGVNVIAAPVQAHG